MKQAPLFYIVYDAIDNATFRQQVIKPLLKKCKKNAEQKAYIIHFEQQKMLLAALNLLAPDEKNIEIITLKKLPYLGTLSLWYAAQQLKKVLKQYDYFQLIARGAHAGIICRYAHDNKRCTSFIIQAHELLAEQYAYAQADKQQNRFKKTLCALKIWQLKAIERKAYNNVQQTYPVTIEAISTALKEYLIATFDTERENIIVAAHEDNVDAIAQETCHEWKNATRKELKIDNDAIVYCYNGSLEPSQRPEMIIDFFKDAYNKNTNAFLLILTPYAQQFNALLQQNDIAQKNYCVMSVNHDEIYRYMAAGDIGILFRTPHIVNWVSRPADALHYQAVNLAIAHNDTVAWLMR